MTRLPTDDRTKTTYFSRWRRDPNLNAHLALKLLDADYVAYVDIYTGRTVLWKLENEENDE